MGLPRYFCFDYKLLEYTSNLYKRALTVQSKTLRRHIGMLIMDSSWMDYNCKNGATTCGASLLNHVNEFEKLRSLLAPEASTA